MEQLTYNIYRNLFKKTTTSHLGKVVETEDKIICFVDKNKVKKKVELIHFLVLELIIIF